MARRPTKNPVRSYQYRARRNYATAALCLTNARAFRRNGMSDLAANCVVLARSFARTARMYTGWAAAARAEAGR